MSAIASNNNNRDEIEKLHRKKGVETSVAGKPKKNETKKAVKFSIKKKKRLDGRR